MIFKLFLIYRKAAKIAESSLIPLTQFPSCYQLTYFGIFVQLMHQYWYIIINWSPWFTQIFLVFT